MISEFLSQFRCNPIQAFSVLAEFWDRVSASREEGQRCLQISGATILRVFDIVQIQIKYD